MQPARAVFWPTKYDFTVGNREWNEPLRWVAGALRELGVEVQMHRGLVADLSPHAKPQWTEDHQVAVVTHTSAWNARRFGVDAERIWVVKSTGPSRYYTTLDPLGYGPYSSITYERPDLHRDEPSADELARFWEDLVPGWIAGRTSKWGREVLGEAGEIEEDDYVLVLAQTLGDETTAGMAWGSYKQALAGVVWAAVQVQDRPVVVKLHPWTDGKSTFDHEGKPRPPDNTRTSDELRALLEAQGAKVYSGMASVHDYLPRARVAVTCNSGSGIEALMHLVPVVSWGYPEYHWAGYDLRHICDLPRALELDWYDQGLAARWIWWYLRRYCFWDEESALRRVRELLEAPPT